MANVELSKQELTLLIRSLTSRADMLESVGKDITEYEALEEKLRSIRETLREV